MNLSVVGLNHTSAPLALREQLAFTPAVLDAATASARAWFGGDGAGAAEAAILSTCNRTELYVAAPQAAGIDGASRFLAGFHGLDHAALRPHLYLHQGAQAARHAFRVAAGLDSMVLGEAQILGQMKDAVRHAQAGAALGPCLHQMFQRAFAAAKEVRSNTGIGTHSVSVAGAALRLAQRIFPAIAGQHVLFVGAGEMIALCAAHFAAHGPASITVANRSLARAEALAARHGGRAVGLDALPAAIAASDIVISCTGSALPVIEADWVQAALAARRRKPLFMADLAVPRDIGPGVAGLEDVFLYTIDDLGALVQSGRERRQAAVAGAEEIIGRRVRDFMQWTETRAMVPLIRGMQQDGEALRLAELQRARRMLAAGQAPEAVLEALSRGLNEKFLHGPRQALRQARGDQRAALCTLLPSLFRAPA